MLFLLNIMKSIGFKTLFKFTSVIFFFYLFWTHLISGGTASSNSESPIEVSLPLPSCVFFSEVKKKKLNIDNIFISHK